MTNNTIDFAALVKIIRRRSMGFRPRWTTPSDTYNYEDFMTKTVASSQAKLGAIANLGVGVAVVPEGLAVINSNYYYLPVVADVASDLLFSDLETGDAKTLYLPGTNCYALLLKRTKSKEMNFTCTKRGELAKQIIIPLAILVMGLVGASTGIYSVVQIEKIKDQITALNTAIRTMTVL